MDGFRLSEQEIVSFDRIAHGVSGLRTLFVNLFGVVQNDGRRWTLVDAGVPLEAARIRNWADERFGTGNVPEAIVLTHGHFDHVGSIQDLLKHWDVPVYAHGAELPFLTGQEKYPPPDPSVGGGLLAAMSSLYPRSWADLSGRVRELPADGSLPTMPGWRWLHTPGHAPGHVSLFRDEDRTLIAGDAFCTTKQESFLAVAQQRPELTGPPAYYTPDWDAARASVEKLAALRPLAVAPGHGQPIAGAQVAADLNKLATHFEEFALPKHGKYVNRPGLETTDSTLG